MKLCFVLVFSLLCLNLAAQNSTFNMGWTTKAERILCSDRNTIIVTGDVSPEQLTSKYVAKFVKRGNSYTEEGRLYIYDTILDYRFHNGKLNLISHFRVACDYPPHDTSFIQIDTATMTMVNSVNLGREFNLNGAAFSSDSSLFIVGQPLEPSYFVDFNMAILDSIETYVFGIKHLQFILSGKYILVQDLSGVSLIHLDRFSGGPVGLDSTYYPFITFGNTISGTLRGVHVFDEDSLFMLTENGILKGDTSLQNTTPHALSQPFNFIFSDSTYTLIRDNKALHYRVSDHSPIKTDSLTGLPQRFDLRDLWIKEDDTLIIASSGGKAALRELHLQNGFHYNPPAGDYSLTLDSVVLNSIVPSNQHLYNRQANFSIYCSNTGSAPITNFKLLYLDHPEYGLCTTTRDRDIDTNIAPGQSVVLKQSINYWNWANTCFYISAPDHKVEGGLSDNHRCKTVSLNVDTWTTEKSIQVFPNPTNNYLVIQLDEPSTGKVEVDDLTGKICRSKSFSKSEVEIGMKLAELKPGIYLLRVELTNGTTAVERIALSKN